MELKKTMSWKRSERLIDMTHHLLNHPKTLIPLTYFSMKYDAAKSSISEDIAILKETFEREGIGKLVTYPGASGGVKFHIKVRREEVTPFVDELCETLEDERRLLAGGYLYMSDILGDPKLMDMVGKIFATIYSELEIDAIMTVATKGIPIAHAIAKYLNVPVVIVRREYKVTEGSTVSINYVSGSSKRIQTMLLSKRSLKEGSRVLIVDDFMKAGGTINGMINLLDEFQAHLSGIGVLVESERTEERLVEKYVSMLKLSYVNEKEKEIRIVSGNYMEHEEQFL